MTVKDETNGEEMPALLHELAVRTGELELQNRELLAQEIALQQARDRYFELFELAPVGHALLAARGDIEVANLWLARSVEVPRTALVGRNFASLLGHEHAAAFHRFHAALRRGEAPGPLPCELRTRSGRRIPVGLHAHPIRGDERSLAVAVVDARDRVAAEHAERVERDLRRAHVHALLHAQDEERRRIARELHDESGQALASVEIGLARLMHVATDPTLRELGGQLTDAVRRVAAELRRIARGLHPAVLDDLGLAAALEQLTAEQPGGPSMTLSARGTDGLDRRVALAVYRVVQEALGNAIRHGNPRRVDVSTVRDGDRLRLEIADDGRGFTDATVGLGLPGMRERVEELGGRLSVESQPDRGTRVIAEIPLVPRG